MKTQLLEQALKEIQEEDQLLLEDIKEELEATKKEIDKKKKTLENAKIKERKYELLTEMDKNVFKYIHSLLPFVEIPAIIMILASLPGLSLGAILLLVLVSIGLLDDALIVYAMYYVTLGMEESIFKNIVKSINEISKSKKSHNRGLIRAISEKETIKGEIRNLEGKLRSEARQIDDLREELSFVEGSSIGLQIMNDKYGIYEVPEDNEVSEFLEARKTLTRHI